MVQAELDDKRRVQIARERQVLKECEDRAARLNSEVRGGKWEVGSRARRREITSVPSAAVNHCCTAIRHHTDSQYFPVFFFQRGTDYLSKGHQNISMNGYHSFQSLVPLRLARTQ